MQGGLSWRERGAAMVLDNGEVGSRGCTGLLAARRGTLVRKEAGDPAVVTAWATANAQVAWLWCSGCRRVLSRLLEFGQRRKKLVVGAVIVANTHTRHTNILTFIAP